VLFSSWLVAAKSQNRKKVNLKIWARASATKHFLSNQVKEFEPTKKYCTTPWKINMEPANHLIEKENQFPSTSIFGFKMLIFQGVTN